MQVVISRLPNQLLRGLTLHLLLKGVPSFIIEETVRVPGPGDAFHQARIVLNVDVVFLGFLQLMQLLGVLVWDRPR